MKKRNAIYKQREAWMRRVMKSESFRNQPLPPSIAAHEDRKYQKMMRVF